MGRHRSDRALPALPDAGSPADTTATLFVRPDTPPAPEDLPVTDRLPVQRAATASGGRHQRPASVTGEHPLSVPGTGPHRHGHRAPAPWRATGLLVSARAAGAVALVGAIAGVGVASAGTGAVLADPPTDTGGFQRPDPVTGGADLAAVSAVSASTPRTTTTTSSAAARRTDDDSGSSRSSGSTSTPKTTTPATTSSTAARSTDDGGRTLWSADFGSAGMGNFKSTPWNAQGSPLPKVGGGTLNVSMPGGGKRSEVEPDFKELSEGDEYYFGFSVRLASDFPVDTSDWQVITQFKNSGTGSPPLEVKVQDGHFLLDGDSGGFSQVIGDAHPGQWTHLVLRVKFSSSAGSVSAWQDGAQKIANLEPSSGTLYSGRSSYVKTGLYRDTSISQPGKLSFGSWAIGTSLGSVSKDLPTD